MLGCGRTEAAARANFELIKTSQSNLVVDTAAPVTFVFYAPITAMTPLSGPAAGGTSITFTVGGGISKDLQYQCRFSTTG